MRVALVVPAFPLASEGFIVDQFLGLFDRGIDVHLVAERENRDAWSHFPELDRSDILARIHLWPKSFAQRLLRTGHLLLRALASQPAATVRCAHRELRIGLSGAPGRFAFALFLLVRRVDLVHLAFGSLLIHRGDLGEALGCRLVVSFRGFDINYYALERASGYRDVWPKADRVHFLGDDLRRRAIRRGLPESLPCELIPPAVDAARYRPGRDRPREVGGTLRLLSVGRLHWKKGYEYAVQAAAQLAAEGCDVEYRIVGGGDFEPAVRACILDLGLEDRVRLLGETDRDSVREQMQWADVFVHAAVSEGFCNAVMEAQAMELPVVCSDADGLAENVADGVSGIVVARRDAQALAMAIASLARDPERCRAMGRAGRSRVEERFSPERQIRAFAEFYARALADPQADADTPRRLDAGGSGGPGES